MKRIVLFLLLVYSVKLYAQNPIIRNQFTADPSARVFNGKIYVYPSHDIPVPEGKNLRKDWFCMEDYHVFSSDNLVDWVDHGVILTQYQIPWVDSTTYSMWAPDCVERNGKYYFYFPAISKDIDSITGRKLFRIGVAISDKPEGPFIPQPEPIKGVVGIDPCVFIDKDGQAYLYWSLGKIYVAKLKENMLELDSEPVVIENLPKKGLIEGPWVFERNGIYYLTFPHVENEIERLEYAIGYHPLGPFKMAGVIMDESPMKCWTNHHSIIEYKGQWYLFYHQNHFSPRFDKNRSVCIDSLFFNQDGTIRKIIPTERGVGITYASTKIEIDRYSLISEKGAEIAFNDTNDTFKGWKVVLNEKNAWVQYNSVNFESNNYNEIILYVYSQKGAFLKIFLDKIDNKPIAEINVPPSSNWRILRATISKVKAGTYNLIVLNSEVATAEVDWISFNKKK
ncbi:MAG: family 43 glycosylhydrolase [Melioribacter sp.]|nr:family 43 glycosylhydrolase [Melioribacter sp.]